MSVTTVVGGHDRKQQRGLLSPIFAILTIAILASVVALAWILVWPGGASGGAQGSASSRAVRFDGPLPACHQAETLTPHRAPEDWRRTLLDPAFRLAPTDVPADLVSVTEAGIAGRGKVLELVIEDLRAMDRAARRDGVAMMVTSAYRSYDDQAATFESLERAYGSDYALESAARPGHSEHQLGTALDIDRGDPWLTEEGWRYGFVVSYLPEWSPSRTCYKPESWHVRYIGREAAAAVHKSGLSLREWLWGRQR